MRSLQASSHLAAESLFQLHVMQKVWDFPAGRQEWIDCNCIPAVFGTVWLYCWKFDLFKEEYKASTIKPFYFQYGCEFGIRSKDYFLYSMANLWEEEGILFYSNLFSNNNSLIVILLFWVSNNNGFQIRTLKGARLICKNIQMYRLSWNYLLLPCCPWFLQLLSVPFFQGSGYLFRNIWKRWCGSIPAGGSDVSSGRKGWRLLWRCVYVW